MDFFDNIVGADFTEDLVLICAEQWHDRVLNHLGQQSKEWSAGFLRGVLSQLRGKLYAWSQRKACVYLSCFAEPPVTAQLPDISFYGGLTIYPPARYEREYAAIDQAEKPEVWHRDMVKDGWQYKMRTAITVHGTIFVLMVGPNFTILLT